MANPVDTITNFKKTNEDNYRFPAGLGSAERGEDKFTFFESTMHQIGGLKNCNWTDFPLFSLKALYF